MLTSVRALGLRVPVLVLLLLTSVGACRGERAPQEDGDAAAAARQSTGPRPSGTAADQSARRTVAVAEREPFARAEGERAWRFPRDHGAHPEYGTEWWYATGIVRDPAGRRFGYELTFFRLGLSRPPIRTVSSWRAQSLLLAHLAVSDLTQRRFLSEERLERAAHGWAGADTARLDVWIDGWRLAAVDGSTYPAVGTPSAAGATRGRSEPTPLAPKRTPAATELHLTVPAASTEDSIGLELRLSTDRPPVLHGANGLAVKDARADPHASWYVSLPRLETRGTLTVSGEELDVTGHTWMDHEFFTGGLSPRQTGWDWFSCRLADGRDIMLLRLRDETGRTDFAAGTVTAPDGAAWRPLDVAGAVFVEGKRWRSDRSGALYPVEWRVRLPGERLELRSRTPLEAQEMARGTVLPFAYWEGVVDYTGTWDGNAVTGEGYVEMTGYDRTLRLP